MLPDQNFLVFSILWLGGQHTAQRLMGVRTGPLETVSHIDHKLPGQSSISIIRTFTRPEQCHQNQNPPTSPHFPSDHEVQRTFPLASVVESQDVHRHQTAFSSIPFSRPSDVHRNPTDFSSSPFVQRKSPASFSPSQAHRDLPAFSPNSAQQSPLPTADPRVTSRTISAVESPGQRPNLPVVETVNGLVSAHSSFSRSPPPGVTGPSSRSPPPGVTGPSSRSPPPGVPGPSSSSPPTVVTGLSSRSPPTGVTEPSSRSPPPGVTGPSGEQLGNTDAYFPELFYGSVRGTRVWPVHLSDLDSVAISPVQASLDSVAISPDSLDSGEAGQGSTGTNTTHFPLFPGDDETVPGPFSPRFGVGKLQVTEDDAMEEIQEEFEKAGLYPGLLPGVPGGLVNTNYGFHGCVHLGTELDPATTVNQPTRVTFPVSGEFQSLVLVDVESSLVHWMIVNIPGGKVSQGDVVAAYQPPSSRFSSGEHRYVALALVQKETIVLDKINEYSAVFCAWKNRENFDLKKFMQQFNLEIIAGNYFKMFHKQEISEQVCNFTFI